MKRSNKPIAIIFSLLLFTGLVYWIYTITQAKENYQEPVIYVLADEANLTPPKRLKN